MFEDGNGEVGRPVVTGTTPTTAADAGAASLFFLDFSSSFFFPRPQNLLLPLLVAVSGFSLPL